MKRKRYFGFTLIELLVVVAIIALLISILLPSLSRARELSKRVVCSSNLSGLGKACKIYSNDNDELWPIPAFDTTLVGGDRIKYTSNMVDAKDAAIAGGPACNEAANRASASVPSAPGSPPGCATPTKTLTTTRALWMLIRAGDVQPKGFICPSSGDTTDPTNEIDAYYDFSDITNVSYGYQVPFGPTQTRPSENVDSRMAMAADKGPFSASLEATPPSSPANMPTASPPAPNETSAPTEWKAYNSGNHGGRGAGEGQNVLFQDGHASFERTPIVGVDQDNIYTLMNNVSRVGRQLGKHPGETPKNPHPGEKTFGTASGAFSSTDSLIYP